MLQGVGGLWASGRPNGGNNPNCIWMSDYGTFDYRFDDLTCDTTFSEIYTICESDTGGVWVVKPLNLVIVSKQKVISNALNKV